MPGLVERLGRLQQTGLQLIPRHRERGVLVPRILTRVSECALGFAELPFQFRLVPREERMIFFRVLPGVRERLLRRCDALFKLGFYERVRGILLRCDPFCLGEGLLGRRETPLEFALGGRQRVLLLPGVATRIVHRLAQFRDPLLEFRFLPGQCRPLFVRGAGGVGERLFAGRNLRVGGGQLRARPFEFGGEAVPRVRELGLQVGQCRRMLLAFARQFIFELMMPPFGFDQLHLGLLLLDDHVAAGLVERREQMLVLPAGLGEFRGQRFLLFAHLIALHRESGKFPVPGFFKVGEQDGDALHFRLGLVPFARDVFQLGPESREFLVSIGDLPVETLE